MVGRFGLAKGWEFVVGGPIEFAGIHDAAAGDSAVAGQVFGCRMDHQRRAVFNRAAQVRRGRRVVDDQRNAGVVRDCRNRIKVSDIAAGVGDRFAENGAGVVVNSSFDRVQIVEIDEGTGPTKTFDRLAKLRDRTAVKARRGDDI